MQISSSHSGFNFNSVYKSVVTRQVPQPQITPTQIVDASTSERDDNTEKVNREALLLKAAHRSADRTADQLEALPDL
jgi:hypothetical protein